MAIAALVLGILALLIVLLFSFKWLGVILAIAGAVLGFLGRKSEKKTLAIIGIVLSLIAVIWVLILLPIIDSVFGNINDALGSY